MRKSSRRGFATIIVALQCSGLWFAATTAAALSECAGDCDRDGEVRIDELVTGVGVSLGTIESSACSGFACPGEDEGINIACLVSAVNNALGGCSTPSVPTATAMRTPTSPPSPTPTRIEPPPFTYRLAQGSSIAFRPAEPGSPLLSDAPLSGTFTVESCVNPLPNTRAHYVITEVDFHTPTGPVLLGGAPGTTGCLEQPGIGSVDVSTLYGPQAGLRLLVDGVTVPFSSHEFTVDDLPPTFHGLELCGAATGDNVRCSDIRSGSAGYILTIFAQPDAMTATPTPTFTGGPPAVPVSARLCRIARGHHDMHAP